jgi:hypothetical protein
MGTPLMTARELSFQDQLMTIFDSEGSYTEAAQDVEDKNGDGQGYTTHSEFQGQPNNPYEVEAQITQNTPHRPEVDDTVVERLHRAVRAEKSNVPTRKLDFDDNLSIVLDAAERYYEALYCEISLQQSTLPSGLSSGNVY